MLKKTDFDAWPALPYDAFKPTAHLLHMAVQMLGKLKLTTPFEPHWANVGLWLTSRGLTTGLIPHGIGCFSIDLNIVDHEIRCLSTWGDNKTFPLKSMSVAEFYRKLFDLLLSMRVDIRINEQPQEIPNPVPFSQDKVECNYDPNLANAWWRILISSYRVMQRYHAKFTGRTPPIALMWGTFDLRDARYLGTTVPTTGINADYIRRNAMDAAQVETGWWSGNEAYQKPAYFSFIYPQPKEIERAKIKPSAAHWDQSLGQFILDYDAVRSAKDPEKDLMDFFESSYKIESEKAGWDKKLIGKGTPV